MRGVAALIVPVLPEESYHWLYAKHLDFGYYDHPPMIAWLIALGTAVFGDVPFGIRLLPWLCSIGTSIAAAWTARELYGEKAASWTALLLAIQPTTFMASSFGFPDAPLLLFWTLTLASGVRALGSRGGRWWLVAGACYGAALLSKYTAIFLGLSLLLYLLAAPRHRYWLRTPWPYLGALTALIVFSPVLIWNATHDWASLRFQSVGRLEEGGGARWTSGPAYLLLQGACVLPLALPAVVAAVGGALRSRSLEQRYLLSFSLPLLLFFLGVGVFRSTHAFWPLPAWIALTILSADFLSREDGRIARFYRTSWREMTAIFIVAAGLGLAHSVRPLPGLTSIRSLNGWARISERAASLRSGLGADSFYLGVGKRYLCPSQLAFHLHAPRDVHSKNLLGAEGLQFTYWADVRALAGRDAVIVGEAEWSTGLDSLLRRHFRSVEEIGAPLVVGGSSLYKGLREERYRFYVGHEYRPGGQP
ncbi:MAG: glycosyltransferase family 39 protein [Planctomycetaceae bacterium]|nr:glycosyltransferase family 39 protein [Planctomycetaceae bacterium]